MPYVQKQLSPGRMAIWAVFAAIIVVLGIAYYLRVKAQKPPNFEEADSSAPIVTAGVAVPLEVQTSAEHTIQTFLENLRRQDYSQALKTTTDDFPTPHTPTALKTFAQNQAFAPIFSGPLNFDAAHMGSHGQKLFLRASVRANGKPYLTVCTLAKSKGGWLISGILDPVPPSAPPLQRSMGARSH